MGCESARPFRWIGSGSLIEIILSSLGERSRHHPDHHEGGAGAMVDHVARPPNEAVEAFWSPGLSAPNQLSADLGLLESSIRSLAQGWVMYHPTRTSQTSHRSTFRASLLLWTKRRRTRASVQRAYARVVASRLSSTRS